MSRIIPDGKLFGVMQNGVWCHFVAMVTQILVKCKPTFSSTPVTSFDFLLNWKWWCSQARNQDFMWGGANEAKVDQTTEMYFLLSDPFIQESSDTWKVLTTKYAVGTEYYICRIQLFE